MGSCLSSRRKSKLQSQSQSQQVQEEEPQQRRTAEPVDPNAEVIELSHLHPESGRAISDKQQSSDLPPPEKGTQRVDSLGLAPLGLTFDDETDQPSTSTSSSRAPPFHHPAPQHGRHHLLSSQSSTWSDNTSYTKMTAAMRVLSPSSTAAASRALSAARSSSLPTTSTRAFSSSICRRSDAHDSHYDPPSGWLFGVKPGEKAEKEGWENIWVYGFFGSIALGVVGYAFKPDTSIQTWALEEARRRLEVEGILKEPKE
ncbi:hypothetical protein G7Y89_g3355 [Cudoniella acicularis]|uniref:NADH dehydrogenase [ubiquinone] 1 beta subcomplex subunit 11, mitochondrial n=1 Tax=Cudoniella acicularis TaxID=354080 RepID=A0A8H4RSD6_9HELO|nr:hypothetical protein G7Y89_g3355 [Cudoniella acicularis]